MTKNMGKADRVTRVLLAAIIGVLYFTNLISGVVAVVLVVIASIFLLTSSVSFCPLYAPFGIKTCATKSEE